MDHVVAKWIVFVTGIVAAGAAGWLAVPYLASPRGVPGPGVLDAAAPMTAALALALAFIASSVVGVIAARLLNPVVGMFTLGIGLGILSLRSGTIRDACFDGHSLVSLGVESVILGAFIAVASAVIHLASTPMHSARGAAARLAPREIVSPKALQMAAIGAVSIVGVWLLVTSSLKGQAVGAAIVGGFLAGHVGKRAAPGHEPVLLFAAPVVVIGLAQIVLSWTIADPGASFVRGSIPNLVAVMPLDLAAGSIIGVALGVGMSRTAIAQAAGASASRRGSSSGAAASVPAR